MSKLIRRTVKKRGAALLVALQLTALTFLSLISFIGGPQQPVKAPADSQMSGPVRTQTAAADQTDLADQAQTQTAAQAQTQTAQPLTAADQAALRASGVFARYP